ncbi:unnamed protein product [Soboliphyme baturini]|uniref:Peptidase S1 domain-containing protein n=1 Tax=Soboliphyme baturini TaxID=241478 RepID=A0A183J7B9_9BILA|nr:unnamed protein product [Soboliphyme baturini]
MSFYHEVILYFRSYSSSTARRCISVLHRVNWDPQLASFAGKLAVQCNYHVNSQPHEDHGVAMWYSYKKNPPTPKEIIKGFKLQGVNFYDNITNQCKIDPRHPAPRKIPIQRRKCHLSGHEARSGTALTVRKDENCPYLKPVYDIYSDYFRTHYYVSDISIYNVRISEKWRLIGIIGYAVQGPVLCGANVVIYEFFDKRVGYIQVPQGLQVNSMLQKPSPNVYYGGPSFALWN